MPLLMALLLFISMSAQAQSFSLQAEGGELLQVQQLKSGEYWLTVRLSDRNLDSFASHELILLQLDNDYPMSIVEGLRSCAGAARPPQQFFYDYQASGAGSDWQLNAVNNQPSIGDMLINTARPVADFPTINADRRPEWFDFRIAGQANAEALWQQMQHAKQITLLYTTETAERRQVIFTLPVPARLD
ncbi:hypothetical protein [Methylophaga lonarensis]|uniref:hypothetical protein n=1 Tax=Methylophaga lonarensis TaxID=999151 RepID=UPI003D2B44F7